MAIPLGPNWEHALRASPYRLRFELNQSEPTYVNMFTGSYDRARRLAREALGADNVFAVLAANPRPQHPFGITRQDWATGPAFQRLAAMGVDTDEAEAVWSGYVWKDDERDPKAKPWTHRAVRLSWDDADILLWNQVAQDMGIYPQAPVVAKLVNLERAVSVYAYDDRGMDITALRPEPIARLHQDFDSWLLDYDRPRMSEVFQGTNVR